MKRIRFKGNEYIFGADSLDDSGFIATEEQYTQGTMPFAHYWNTGNISQFGLTIGYRDDIEIIGDYFQPEDMDVDTAITNIAFDPSWDEGEIRSVENIEKFRETCEAMEREGVPLTRENLLAWHERYEATSQKNPGFEADSESYEGGG